MSGKRDNKLVFVGVVSVLIVLIFVFPSTIMGLTYEKTTDSKCSNNDRFFMFTLSFGILLFFTSIYIFQNGRNPSQ